MEDTLTHEDSMPVSYRLANGLDVVLVKASGAPVATIMVVYRVGSRNEAVGYTGSSHLLEHMLFKGTPKNNRANGRAFADIMNEIGATKNATTWIDRTNYFETVPSEYLDFAIELEADRMRSAIIADADRQSEMTVVRNELERADNSLVRVINSALVATAFREHPYHHPTIGWRSDVEGVSTARLRELYDTFYHPNNAALFIVGDFHEARTRDTIDRTFGALPASAQPIPSVYTEEPAQTGERHVVVKRPGDTALVALAFHTPAALGQQTVLDGTELSARARDLSIPNDTFALDVLARILGSGRTSRLARALVDTGLALDVSAWNWGSRDPGLFQIIASVRPGVEADGVRRAVDATLDELTRDGPTTAELERAVAQMRVARAFARDGTLATAQRLGEFEAVGTWRLEAIEVDRAASLEPDAVRDVARAYLHEDNRTLGTLLAATAKTFDVVPFEPTPPPTSVAVAVEAAVLQVPVVKRASRFAERIVRGTLGNGVTWNYVCNPDNPTFSMRGIIDAGPAFEPMQPMVSALVAEMLSRGSRRHPRQAIEERLERAGVRRHYSVDGDRSAPYNPLAFRLSGASTSADAELLLETVAEELREPAFDAAELALVAAETAGTLTLARTSTNFRSIQRFLQLAYELGDANAAPEIDELLADIAATDVERIRAFHRTYILGNKPIISAAGSLSPEEFATVLERSIGSVPFAGHRVDARPVVRSRAARDVREDVALERKANVDIVLGRATTLVRSSPDYLAALVANGILGQSTLSSRLGLQLRDREGLTYGITSSFLSPGILPGPWRVSVSVNPANVDHAIASVRAVLRRYATDGPTERELRAQRNSMAGQHVVSLATNAGIAAQLERLAYFRLPSDDIDTYGDRLAAVTADDAMRAIDAYLTDRDLIVAAAGTFAPSTTATAMHA